MALTIDILYTEENSDWQELDKRVQQALEELGINAEIRHQIVKSDREAFELNFIGTPTLLIDGIDPWPMKNAPAGLRLRPYFSPTGGMVNYPTYEMIVEALHEHTEE